MWFLTGLTWILKLQWALWRVPKWFFLYINLCVIFRGVLKKIILYVCRAKAEIRAYNWANGFLFVNVHSRINNDWSNDFRIFNCVVWAFRVNPLCTWKKTERRDRKRIFHNNFHNFVAVNSGLIICKFSLICISCISIPMHFKLQKALCL